MFDCGVVLHLKLGNPQGTDPVSHRNLLPSSLDADPWSIASAIGITVMDLGLIALGVAPVNATDPWSQQGGRVRPWDLGSVINA